MIRKEWGTGIRVNTEVARELSYSLPSKRQIAADYGHDFAGLSKQEVTALFASAPETVKEKFTAVKPWIAEVNRPLTAPEELDFSLPDEALQISWIYGMRTGDVRGCCRYTVDGDIVYPAASVGVLFNKAKHRQRFFMDHRQEIVLWQCIPRGILWPLGKSSRPGNNGVGCSENGENCQNKIFVWGPLCCYLSAQMETSRLYWK